MAKAFLAIESSTVRSRTFSLRRNLADRLRVQKHVLQELIDSGAFEQPLDLSIFQDVREGFLNVSNHPLHTWSSAQKEAALALKYGDLKDFEHGFPPVPSQATSGDVSQLAQDLVDKIVEQKPAAVYIAGEFSLAFKAVSLLQRKGIKCFTTSSDRRVEQTLQADGSTHTTSVFQFAGWREYPEL